MKRFLALILIVVCTCANNEEREADAYPMVVCRYGLWVVPAKIRQHKLPSKFNKVVLIKKRHRFETVS